MSSAPGAAMVCFASIAGQVAPVPDDLAALLDEPLADGFLERFASLLDGNEAATGTAYGLAKHGVMRFCEREAPAFGERGARIVSISPGLITDTPQGKQELAEQPAMPVMIDMTPLKRGGRADEIAAVVEFWRAQGTAEYDQKFLEAPKEERGAAAVDGGAGDGGDDNDPLFEDAVRLVIEFGKASTSLLQRRLRIGYGRAAHLIDLMERDGIVGAADGPKPREVLKRPTWISEVEESMR